MCLLMMRKNDQESGEINDGIVIYIRATNVANTSEKETVTMKKKVPYTSVSVDSEIEEMRKMLTSEDDLVIDTDGTIGRASDMGLDDANGKSKASTVPKTVVSMPEERENSVRDLINEIRGDDAEEHESEVKVEPMDSNTQKKASVVPKSIVSSEEEDVCGDERENSVRDLINEIRGDVVEERESEAKIEPMDSNTQKKASVVPKSIVSSEEEGVCGDEPHAPFVLPTIPETVVSAGQWYENNPELLKAEKRAMYDYMGEKAVFHIMKDGSASWLVSARPRVPCFEKCRNCTMKNCKRRCTPEGVNARNVQCRKYDLLLLYDQDHPQVRYGSSVKTIPLQPTISDLQKIVNRNPNIPDDEKSIPHLLLDDRTGELYLCTADKADVSADIASNRGVTSAATSLRFALRYINIFELGLLDHETWAKFKNHGEI